jgi:hypothetical protein
VTARGQNSGGRQLPAG